MAGVDSEMGLSKVEIQAQNHATLWASKSKNKRVCEKLLEKKITFAFLKIKTMLYKLLCHGHIHTHMYTHFLKYRYTTKQYVWGILYELLDLNINKLSY